MEKNEGIRERRDIASSETRLVRVETDHADESPPPLCLLVSLVPQLFCTYLSRASPPAHRRRSFDFPRTGGWFCDFLFPGLRRYAAHCGPVRSYLGLQKNRGRWNFRNWPDPDRASMGIALFSSESHGLGDSQFRSLRAFLSIVTDTKRFSFWVF